MYAQTGAFVASAIEAFELQTPIYQFIENKSAVNDLSPFWDDPNINATQENIEESFSSSGKIIPLANAVAHTVLCAGSLEFCYKPKNVLDEIDRILVPGGAILICTPTKPHRSASSPGYWQLTPLNIERLFQGTVASIVGWQGHQTAPHTLYGIGFKAPMSPALIGAMDRFVTIFQMRIKELSHSESWFKRIKTLMGACLPKTLLRKDHSADLHFSFHYRIHSKGPTPQEDFNKSAGNIG